VYSALTNARVGKVCKTKILMRKIIASFIGDTYLVRPDVT